MASNRSSSSSTSSTRASLRRQRDEDTATDTRNTPATLTSRHSLFPGTKRLKSEEEKLTTQENDAQKTAIMTTQAAFVTFIIEMLSDVLIKRIPENKLDNTINKIMHSFAGHIASQPFVIAADIDKIAHTASIFAYKLGYPPVDETTKKLYDLNEEVLAQFEKKYQKNRSDKKMFLREFLVEQTDAIVAKFPRYAVNIINYITAQLKSDFQTAKAKVAASNTAASTATLSNRRLHR
jgi:hypothetical protein